MEVIVRGEPKEIAALVLAVQERQGKMISIGRNMPATEADRTQLADAIRSVLLETSLAGTQSQRPDSTEHTQKQGEEHRLREPEI